jgi:hypothetical protein
MMIERIAKIIALVISPFLAYGFGISLYRSFSGTGVPHGGAAFIAGFIVFTGIWRLFKRQLEVVCTFEHEITHVLFGLLFLKVPRSFRVTRHEGGEVTMIGGNFLITLAPYFFPTVSYLLLPLGFFFPQKYLAVFLALLGASVAFHIASTWAELHWQQTDLHKAGIVFSLLFLPAANLIFYGALLTLVFGGTDGFLAFWATGVRESFGALGTLIRKL